MLSGRYENDPYMRKRVIIIVVDVARSRVALALHNSSMITALAVDVVFDFGDT